MTTYEVLIRDADVAAGAVGDLEPTPVVRDVFWQGTAGSDVEATAQAWEAWSQKYGPGRQPVQAIVNVTALATGEES